MFNLPSFQKELEFKKSKDLLRDSQKIRSRLFQDICRIQPVHDINCEILGSKAKMGYVK